jgi:hypothetical protein
MTTMTSARCRQLTADIVAACKAIERKHGVTIECAGGRYNTADAVIKLKVAYVNEAGDAETKEMRIFRFRYPQLAGRDCMLNNRRVRFIGYNSRAKAYPIQYMDLVSRRQFKAGEHVVRLAVPIEK